MKNYYQILGIHQDASTEDVKRSFKNHAKHFHPDLHGGSQFFNEKFLEIKEAYDILAHPDRRREYDQAFFRQSESQFQSKTSSNSSNQHQEVEESEDDEIQRILDWSWKKFENGDLEGAIEELEIGETKYKEIGYLNFAKGQIYQNFGLFIPALKEYNIAVKKKYYEAKDSIIEIEKIQKDTLESIKPYLTKYPLTFSLVGIFLFLIIPDFGTGLLLGEVINIIGSIIIIRIGVSKVSRSVLNSFTFNWEYNSSVMIGVLGAIVSLPIVAFFIFNN